MVEGTPLLRVQARKGLEGSNPFVSATHASCALFPCLVGCSGPQDIAVDIIVDITMAYPAAKLVQVKGKWYVQVTIPPDLRAGFNERKQERRSAGTADRAEAERRLHGLAS